MQKSFIFTEYYFYNFGVCDSVILLCINVVSIERIRSTKITELFFSLVSIILVLAEFDVGFKVTCRRMV